MQGLAGSSSRQQRLRHLGLPQLPGVQLQHERAAVAGAGQQHVQAASSRGEGCGGGAEQGAAAAAPAHAHCSCWAAPGHAAGVQGSAGCQHSQHGWVAVPVMGQQRERDLGVVQVALLKQGPQAAVHHAPHQHLTVAAASLPPPSAVRDGAKGKGALPVLHCQGHAPTALLAQLVGGHHAGQHASAAIARQHHAVRERAYAPSLQGQGLPVQCGGH